MYAQILDGLGDRPLGLEADQLVIEIARWIKGRAGVGKLRLKASGISSQAAATVAAALKPDFLAHVVVHSGMPSLRFVLDAPLNFQESPDLFCLELYKDFDLDRLAAMAAPATLTIERHVEAHPQCSCGSSNRVSITSAKLYTPPSGYLKTPK